MEKEGVAPGGVSVSAGQREVTLPSGPKMPQSLLSKISRIWRTSDASDRHSRRNANRRYEQYEKPNTVPDNLTLTISRHAR